MRTRLDQWLADKVTDNGGMVVTKMRVDELLLDGGKVIGVRAGDDEVGADVTIVAEGALGQLAAAAGLRDLPAPRDYAVGMKEIIELPPGTIEDRWNLAEGTGAAQLFVGAATKGMTGGGFLYTNRDSVSLGLVVTIEALMTRGDKVDSYTLLDEFKELFRGEAFGGRRHGRRVLRARDTRGWDRQDAQALWRRLSTRG